jgi:hypothetical protein
MGEIPMVETITRAELNWKEHALLIRIKTLRRLTPEQAAALREIDKIREERGWHEND